MKNFFEKYKSNLLILFALVSCSKDEIENIEEVYNSTCSGLSYLTRPNPVDSDNTHDYYEYAWQADPKICINVYDVSILGGREKKVQASMDWVKLNLPNIVPIKSVNSISLSKRISWNLRSLMVCSKLKSSFCLYNV